MSVKVSVIIAVYNTQDYLPRCLDSITSQTLDDIEIICVDDGSTDQSPKILAEYAARDSRIRIITQQNKYAGCARNVGLSTASGEAVAFLDSDDFFEPDMLELAFKELERVQADFVVFESDQYFMDSDDFVQNPWNLRKASIPPYTPFSYRQLAENVFNVFMGWAWDKLYRRSFLDEHNLRFQELRSSNDLLFVYSALVSAKRISMVYKILAHQRRDGKNSISVTREKSWDCFYHALMALRARLIDEDIFWELEQDFVNYALHFTLWQLRTLAEPTKTLVHDKLRDEWFLALGIKDRPSSYFYDKADYAKYKELL